MTSRVILDTGPLVAFLNKRDRYHRWAAEQLAQLEPPLYTCEGVISEACFLLATYASGSETVLELVHRELVKISFRLEDEVMAIKKLLARYEDIGVSLTDACLVRMAELDERGVVLTLDSDFRVYRKHERHVIPTIMPE
ncbi:PIN domain-containing protein [Candidatus Acetothermia bacterium]|jgi:predicted nucleic acid-binding protein|nr:PIN domain-containing protein [Candidatus Acetothermia bacterium]MCI2431940.1 PIN domain-containing protein [Candidatus Acetothermia bacterium]MCI2436621.1 PIN domain-containing protein [Candidatus Acetothermia bacterium]